MLATKFLGKVLSNLTGQRAALRGIRPARFHPTEVLCCYLRPKKHLRRSTHAALHFIATVLASGAIFSRTWIVLARWLFNFICILTKGAGDLVETNRSTLAGDKICPDSIGKVVPHRLGQFWQLVVEL